MGLISTKIVQETAVLIGLVTKDQTETELQEYLDELEFLAVTSGAKTVKRFTQKMEIPNSKTFLGKGKIAEVQEYVALEEIDMVIFDDDLSPSQLRNIERIFNTSEDESGHKVKILDRSNLILDIFASRARTAHAKTQVELAQYQYLLPRLTRMWTHLERQKGGIGMRGPGETQIETDRRIIQQKIALLKEKLVKIDKQKTSQRSNRGKMVRVALVGYTNVGKSTIMNLMSKSDVFAEDKLFATLDTTVRKVVLVNLPFLLSDTVGFIRKLPHELIESFKSTLDEVREADVLLHVLDISHPSFEDQFNVVNDTLKDIEAIDKPTIIIFNKIDAYRYVEQEEFDLAPKKQENYTLEELKRTWMAQMGGTHCIFISAQKKKNIDELRTILYNEVKKVHQVRYPYNDYLF
jgi:GTP-binding protein HflX